MLSTTVAWDINLRANLRLWPEPTSNVRALAGAIGADWDESDIAREYFHVAEGGDRRRAVRQTYEAMAYEGLLYRAEHGTLGATCLGNFVLGFLGVVGGHCFANESNRIIMAEPMIYGLSILTEVRAIWQLMRLSENRLTNEELNRAMARIRRLEDIDEAANAVKYSRAAGDVTLIGPRVYGDSDFGTDAESAQRRAINPHFLLAGGGGLFINVDNSPDRSLYPAAIRLIDGALRNRPSQTHAATDRATVEAISRASMASPYQIGGLE